jgi:hypothetical protein
MNSFTKNPRSRESRSGTVARTDRPFLRFRWCASRLNRWRSWRRKSRGPEKMTRLFWCGHRSIARSISSPWDRLSLRPDTGCPCVPLSGKAELPSKSRPLKGTAPPKRSMIARRRWLITGPSKSPSLIGSSGPSKGSTRNPACWGNQTADIAGGPFRAQQQPSRAVWCKQIP